jgi:hypothetical protein
MAKKSETKKLEYKGKPIYRQGDKIYYGNLDDKYILVLDILEKKAAEGIDVATKVRMQIQDNSGDSIGGKVFRQSEKDNLYKALDIGEWWLSSAIDEANI